MAAGTTAAGFVASWRPRTVPEEAARFARGVVGRLAVRRARAKALLWSCANLAGFCVSVGYPLEEAVVFSEATIERFVATGTQHFSAASRRTLRTNVRFVAEGLCGVKVPPPAALARSHAKHPYSAKEIARFLSLADAQPTEARRQRANGLLCLGAGAGLTGVDLRAVRGRDIVSRSGGVVVVVRKGRPRAVPVLSCFHDRVLRARSFFGAGFVVGGVEPQRRNVTSPLIASLSGGVDLPRLEIGRLRATWLAEVADLIGLPTFMAAAGITCSQHLGDVVAALPPGDEEHAVALLGGRP